MLVSLNVIITSNSVTVRVLIMPMLFNCVILFVFNIRICICKRYIYISNFLGCYHCPYNKVMKHPFDVSFQQCNLCKPHLYHPFMCIPSLSIRLVMSVHVSISTFLGTF